MSGLSFHYGHIGIFSIEYFIHREDMEAEVHGA